MFTMDHPTANRKFNDHLSPGPRVFCSAVVATAVTLTLTVGAHPAAAQTPPVDLVFIPAEDVQPNGPAHDFRIGRFEIRSDQFVTFLNDAKASLDNERGQYLYFDTGTGSVYVHSTVLGTIGVNGSGTLLFDASVNPHVSYNAVSETYEVVEVFEDHPVVGVTWYGAIKYCNWLTIDAGLALTERAYTEAPSDNLAGWHPVTIPTDAWTTRDLNETEREALLAYWGYRLPMDGGDGGDPGPFNEWYKAAAWDGALAVNHSYGFGRDTIDDPDANYRCSGDPFEDSDECEQGGTTPVGFFDGVNVLSDGVTPTTDTDNPYSLYDMSGNVWEWMQNRSVAPADRRNRGGSFRSSGSSLQVDIGGDRAADAASDSTGFRVAQSVVSDLFVVPDGGLVNSGPWGGPYDDELPTTITYRVTNVTDLPVGFIVLQDEDWITVNYTQPPDDVLAAGQYVDVTVEITPQCTHQMHVGTNQATVTVLNLDDGTRVDRTVRLTVTEPITVVPTGSFVTSMVYGDTPPETTYTLKSQSDSAVSWSAAWIDTTSPPTNVDWLTLNGDPNGTEGEVFPSGEVDVTIGFVVDDLPAGTHEATVTITDECTGSQFVRSVILTIGAPFTVTPEENATSTGVLGGPFTPPFHDFTISNLADGAITWHVSVEPVAPDTDTDWLEVAPSDGTMNALGEEVEITATIAPAADHKDIGEYAARVLFVQSSTGFSIERIVTLDVTELVVEPEDDASFAGGLGGPFAPAAQTYTLYNTGLIEMEWTAVFTDHSSTGQTWLELSASAGVILNPEGTVDIIATIAPEATILVTGTYTGEILFTSVLTGATTTRGVTLEVGTEALALEMVNVPAEHAQPDGPDYLYRVGKYEVTNANFVRFLNDAREHPDDGRGTFTAHDTETGIVSLTGDGTTLFDAGVGGVISFTDNRYVISAAENRQLPVVGVSWYGALKFCNWMTLTQGMDNPDQRVYHEGPIASDWYALANPPEILIYRGFRLPMDAQSTEAGPYNEWFKAAAWLDDPGNNAVYGFGRDTLGNADANFHDSGDPHEPGPSPVGFYNGVNTLPTSGGSTNDTTNGYGLYDMTGNVAEWVHDPGDVPGVRGLRGGHFDSLAASPILRNDERGSAPADATLAFVGFRVLQVIEPVDLVISQDAVRAEGFIGGPYREDRERFVVQVRNSGTQTVDAFTISTNVGWLEIDGVPPGYLPPGGVPVDLPFRIETTAENPGLSPTPSGNVVLVPADEIQTDGPDYDYWIGRTEVTNTQFAAFLNAARADALTETPDARSYNMYFDTDSGNVYINDEEVPNEGTDTPSGTLTTLLYDASLGRIQFVDNTYTTEVGFENHPVVGVSWYGAVKYCNWLTISQGIPAALRAYSEAPSPNLGAWHPIVVDDTAWLSGPLPDTARRFLVEDTLGYRLPMDDGVADASAYNEWHKAASRRAADEEGNPIFGSIYGFGRDAPLTGADANFFDSGDTQENGTTPAEHFNGSHALYRTPTECYPPEDPTLTNNTDNGYGLHDATGNVAEWTQDFHGSDPAQHSTRGGSWRDAADSDYLQTSGRGALPPESTTDDTGFRVIRGTGHVATVTITDNLSGDSYQQHFVLDLHEPFQVQPGRNVVAAGLYGDVFAGIGESYTLTNRSASDMDWAVEVNSDWIDLAENVSGELMGALAASDAVTIDITTNELADTLGPGEHTAVITFRNVSTGHADTREVQLTIEPPIIITPVDPDPQAFSGIWGGPFDQPATRTYSMSNAVDFDLEYEVDAGVPWLNVEPVDPTDELTGTLAAGDAIGFVVHVNEVAETKAVGEYAGVIPFTFTDPHNADLTDSVEQTVTLVVDEPIVISQDADPWVVDPNPDPDVWPPMVYTLTNALDTPIEVSIEVDADWLDLTDSLVEVFPGSEQEREIVASLNAGVLALVDGVYIATIQFEDTATGIIQCRTIELSIVEDLSVTPFIDLISAGVAGGPITPSLRVYRLTNVARDGNGPIQWQAFVQEPGADWILFNGAASDNGWLDDGESATVVISIDAAQTTSLAEGMHEAVVEFAVSPDGESRTRAVSLALVVPQFDLTESSVPASAHQENGPAYSYRMATFHTTNTEFVAFLNDAIANPGNDRGEYMFFDTSAGDVYINSSAEGETGTDPGERSVKLFSPVAAEQIEFNSGTYRVRPDSIDFSLHPVTGVSWYGAVKYCNWLTMDRGMLPSERCYTETTDADLNGWHPVTVRTADWITRDLNDNERDELVTHYRGFRLPTDNGWNNTVPATDAADAYNEWYKAASRRGTDVYGNALFGADYGFGRNAPLTGADANFFDSGDPMDNSTTPTGYFDGSYRGDGFYTNPNANGFGLFDMSGNAYQWMQGRFNNHPDSITFRTVRGGSWLQPADSTNLRTDARTFTIPALTDAQVGFRVVRTLPPASGDFDLDGDVDLDDLTITVDCTTGPGQTVGSACGVFDMDNDDDVDLEDFAVFQVLFGS